MFHDRPSAERWAIEKSLTYDSAPRNRPDYRRRFVEAASPTLGIGAT